MKKSLYENTRKIKNDTSFEDENSNTLRVKLDPDSLITNKHGEVVFAELQQIRYLTRLVAANYSLMTEDNGAS